MNEDNDYMRATYILPEEHGYLNQLLTLSLDLRQVIVFILNDHS